MKTRQEYLSQKCTYDDYYGQFVTPAIQKAVATRIGIDRLKRAYAEDEHLNTIPLATWDSFSRVIAVSSVLDKMKEAGDFLSLAGIVCIAKRAAKQSICE
jgi:hypothetical protein